MSSAIQRAELQSQIWKIANDVRGSVDGWDFKQYVLGTLFYRFISENFSNYIEAGDNSFKYAELNDDTISKEIREDAIKTKGYFIYPSQLFINIAKNANTNESLNTKLAEIFSSIENSANGYPSELDIKGLFADFDTTSNRLGNTVKDKNSRLASVIKGVAALDFGKFEDSHIDLFGDAYEFLISNYAANAGKSGGEFFTPQSVSKLIAKLATHKQNTINKIYDPAAGSGSLLLQAKKQFDDHIIEDGFFGQEINHTTYNLARMNMFLHNVNYDKFNIALGNTLLEPQFDDQKPFDAIVSNPPYSVNWIGKDDPTLINDERFAPAGVLAPKSKADFAFVLHCLSYLSSKGRAAIVCFPGIFYRSGAEQKIRKYLVDNNFVETVISLAPNLFYGTSIAVNILILSKHKSDTKTQFIDASGEKFYKKETNNNILTEEHIEEILRIFDTKEDIEYISKSVDNAKIEEENYSLSVNTYVEVKDTREVIDIKELNAKIKATVSNIDRLRSEIDKIVAEIEGDYRNKLLTFGDEVEYKPLGEISNIFLGLTYTPTYVDSGVKFISAQNTSRDFLDLTNVKYITEEEYKNSTSNAKPKKGDILFTRVGSNLGHPVIVDTEEELCIFVSLGFIRVDSDKVLNSYINHWMKTDLFWSQVKKNVHGSAKVNLNTGWLKNFDVPIPSLKEQKRIVTILDKFDTLTNSISEGLPREIELHQTRYEYYRDKLLTFKKLEKMD